MSEVKKQYGQENENIVLHDIEEEMKQSYIDYAMSVIVSRALPDVRDGLKPVQRRILYAMYDMKLTHNAKYKKSAAVVWEVLWKYHPHGDSSVYEAMVRMAQDFSLRYPLIDWQGNFGSIDGDSAAAMRYTEARLTKLAEEMLADIDKDTVDWTDNYDNSRKEPLYLPTKFPALLCNWTMGIAVGMATNMPPHNLTEVCDALIKIVENPEISHEEIMQIIKWPDFPTWGIIFDPEKISEVYKTWRWSIVVRWKVHIENEKWNKIIIDEIPYQVNKSNLVAKIWELAWEGKIQWVKNIVDESNKWKIRISIDLKPGVDPQAVLIKLYKLTDLQTTFPVNNIVLIENWLQPNLLGIKDLLVEFVKFRQNVIYRRSLYLLNKAKARLHILEWLQKAIDIIDDVIALIRGSKTREEAKQGLMKEFEFTEEQAEYILMLRLQTLVWLEIEKILKEIDEKKLDIEYLTGLVTDQEKLNAVVVDEIEYIKQEYGDERRTEVSNNLSVYNLDKAMRDLKKNEDFLKENVLVWRSVDDKIKVIYQTRITSLPEDTYKVYNTNNQEKVFLITEKWDFINPRIKDLPSTNIKWPSIDWAKQFGIKDNIVYLDLTENIGKYLVLVTNKNSIKKIDKEILAKMRKWWNIMKLQPGEKIIKVISVNDGDYLGLITKNWLGIIYNSDDIRPMWRAAGWVTAMILDEWDEIQDMFNYYGNMYLAMFSNLGNAKAILTEDLKIKKRWRAGNVWTKLGANEKIVWAINLDEWEIKLLLEDGQIRTFDVDKVPLLDPYKKMEKVVWGKIKKILV
jgi:DNA gyrase subunit A